MTARFSWHCASMRSTNCTSVCPREATDIGRLKSKSPARLARSQTSEPKNSRSAYIASHADKHTNSLSHLVLPVGAEGVVHVVHQLHRLAQQFQVRPWLLLLGGAACGVRGAERAEERQDRLGQKRVEPVISF